MELVPWSVMTERTQACGFKMFPPPTPEASMSWVVKLLLTGQLKGNWVLVKPRPVCIACRGREGVTSTSDTGRSPVLFYHNTYVSQKLFISPVQQKIQPATLEK